MSTLFVGLVFHEINGRRLFKEYVVDPVPPSVKIIDSYYYQGLDPAIYLHFSTASEDFQKILAAENYELQNPLDTEKELHDPMIPSWWNPGAFQKPRLYRIKTGQASPGNPEDNREVWLWVNQDETEAYFAFLYF